MFWCSAFFIVQLSHPYMATRKTIALTRQTFVSQVMSLLFNMLSRLVIIFLPRSKRLLISWLQSPSAVILEPKKIKSVIVSTGYILYQFTLTPTVYEDSFSPHPHQHMLFVVFLMIAILAFVRSSLTVVLIYTSLMTSNLST